MFADLNLFFAIASSSLTVFLGILVLIHERKSVTNSIFFTHAIIGALWSIANYFSVVVPPESAIFWVRLVLFFAVPHVFLFLLFIKNFPSNFLVKPKQFGGSIIIMFLMMWLTQTHYVFKGTTMVDGEVIPLPGLLMPLFSIVLVTFFLYSVILVVRKFFQSKGIIKRQWLSIGGGLLVSYMLLIFLVFLRVIILNDTLFVPYSPLFILPIFIGAAYAILRHKLFNIKIVAAEILVFILLLASFIQVIVSETPLTLFLGLSVVAFILVAGISLIRSVLREVKQREQLEILSKQLEDANEQLQVLDKARAEFISIASHQLRTPPATIKWYLAAILGGDYGKINPKIRQSIERAQLTNNGLIALIDDMLNASRIERGKMEFLFEPGDIEKIVQDAVNNLVPQAEMKKLKLNHKKAKTEFPQILMDKEKLKQVVNNLIDNAIKYTKAGSVTVELTKDIKNIYIKVKDTGKGLEKSESQTIFEKYGRGKDSQKHASGLGLGLYVAKIIVEHHKGKLSAESAGPGKGTTFVASLPIKTDLKAETFDFTKNQTP